MPTLDELMASMQGVSDEERKAALFQALTTTGLGLLAAPGGNIGQNIGRAGLLGVGDYRNTLAGVQQGKRDQIKLRGEAMDALSKEQGYNDTQKARDILRNSLPGAPAASGPAGAHASSAGGPDIYRQMLERADMFDKNGMPEMGDKYRAQAEKYAPKYKGMETVMRDGKPVLLQQYENRAPSPLEGYGPKPDYKQVDTGGAVGFYDPLTNAQGGQFKKTNTPDALLSNQTTMRGQNMTDARARESNSIAQGNKAQTLTTDMRKEFNSLEPVKAFGQVMPALQSAREATKQDTAAADLNIIYAAAKIFDPTSVVRESETTMVMNSGSPSQRFLGQFNYVAGGGRLTSEARKQLLAQIESRARGYEAPYKSARKTYEAVARKNGVDPADVFIEPSVSAERAPAAGATGGWSIREVK